MKYAEYQVWYHTYNIAIKSELRNSTVGVSTIISDATAIADAALAKFREIEDTPPPQMGMANFDVQGMVDKVIKEASKKK